MRSVKVEFFIGDIAEAYIIHPSGLSWVFHDGGEKSSYWREVNGRTLFHRDHQGLVMLEKANA